MPAFNVDNLSQQVVSVQYFDTAGELQARDVGAGEAVVLVGISLHPTAVALSRRGIISLGASTASAQASVQATVPTFRGYGMTWGQEHVVGARYTRGWVVLEGGTTYICTASAATTTPSSDPTRWSAIALSDSASFLGVPTTSVPEGGLLSRSGAGWTSGLLTDANVGSISTGKVAGLDVALEAKLPKAGGTMTGSLTLSGAPTSSLHAATKAYVDARLPRSGGTMTGPITLSGAPSSALHAATKAYVDSASGVPLTGGTMTGPLTLSGAPSSALHAATKAYADSAALSGGTMTGLLTLSGAPTASLHAATKAYVDSTALAGGQMTGMLTLFGAPVSSLHAATKAYVDGFLPLSGGTLTGQVSLASNPTSANHLTRRGWVDAALSAYLPLTGGALSGALELGPPTAATHAANKEYVDGVVSGGAGVLPLSGGVMTGAITGTHGLVPADGSAPMTGALDLASAATDATGLYHSTTFGQLAYRGAMAVMRGTRVSVSADYTVAVGVGEVEVDASASSVAVTLGDPTTYPASEVVVRRSGQGKFQVVTVRGPGLEDYREDLVLNRDRQTLVLFPYATGWAVVGRSSPAAAELEVDWVTVSAASSTALDVSLDILGRTYRQVAFTGVTDDGGGTVGLTVADGTLFAPSTNKQSVVSVDGTADYDGTYVVQGTAAGKVQVLAAFTSSQSGFLRGTARTKVTNPAAALLRLSTSAFDPHAGVPAGVSISLVDIGQWLASGTGSATILCRSDARIKLRAVAGSAGVVAYLHALPAGAEWGSVQGHSEAITNVVALADAVTGVTNEGGGQVGLSVASSAGWAAGDTATVSGTSSYNGVYTVASVAAGKIVVPAAFSSSQSGTVTSSQACTVTLARTDSFEVAEGVRVLSATAVGSSDARSIIERVTASAIIARFPFDSLGTTSGTAYVQPVRRLTFG